MSSYVYASGASAFSTNDNNNYGSRNMGAEDWKPSSRVLGNGTGGASSISFGDYVPSPESKPTNNSARPRIIGGKIVLPESDKVAAAQAYNAQFSKEKAVPVDTAQPVRSSQTSSMSKILSHEASPAQKPQQHHQHHQHHAKITRNYVGNEAMLEKLRASDFDSKEQHDCNELRPEVHVDYNETHMADAAAHKAPLSESSNKQHKHESTKEMRGCEGYKPNLAAFEGGGLQSSSTELKGPQQVSRSSTRLHAPPGGASSIVFG